VRRAQDVGLVLVAVVVLVLTGSLIAGLRTGGEVAPAARPTPGDEVPTERIRVEVLNASGVPGIARTATQLLRDHGFDVVFYGNARGHPPDSSVVLDRGGRPDAAAAVAGVLRIPAVRSAPDTTLYLETTVVLGRDWVGIDR
jgi:hypothetical protein